VDPMMEEELRRRRLQSVVVEPSPYTDAAAMVGWTRSLQCGPNGGGHGRVDGEAVMAGWSGRWRCGSNGG
jgi:hypothetical protein